MTPKLKKIIIGILVAVVVFITYAILKPDPTAEVLVGNRSGAVSSVSNQEARVLGSQIAQALLRIDQIKLSRDIFSNPIFRSLQDRSQNIEPEPYGRTNPFAPLGDTTVNSVLRDTPTISNSTTTPQVTATTTASVVVEENE